MSKNVNFIRALGLVGVYQLSRAHYGINNEQLALPASVFSNPMTLIPTKEMCRWLTSLEEATKDPDVMLKMAMKVDLDRIGSISHWFFSGHDLASTIRRINMGLHCLQSGAYLAGAQVGPLIKWTYHNPMVDADVKVHDSVRVAVLMTKILRRYLGDDYSPTRVMLSGKRENTAIYEQHFDCEVEWNHSRTEVWLKADLRLAINQHSNNSRKQLAMSFSDLDDFLNMPDPSDEYKVIYEMVNYSCHFGLPTLAKVSQLLGLSEQQFQRRLQKLGINFSTVMGYVLSNSAVDLMQHSVPLEEISKRLGYTNSASFNRMFKKHRGLTPKQYLERFRLNG
ncbi:AraC family transcriptional regulator [Vibrio sp. T187]|uniref:AraC family transcriptional regulator n=1 Tax=Vibrio TaxID=662 RepID=UPI0010C97810|nr:MULTISPECIES: AraC family transcriptional regulator [Vibrio]MBW3695939.1 AraC family transcriptional regulator [Vibrio sp. T187]